MTVLQKKEVEEIKETGYLGKNISITDALIENFYHQILKPEEKRLLEMTFEKNPSQEELDILLKNWDIEAKQNNKNLLLAYFMKYHPELTFTQYEGPRLKGLLKFFRFQNLQLVAKFSQYGKILNQHGIVPLIFKGGLMRHLRPELPRVMGDVDLLVPEKDYEKGIRLGVDLGWEYQKETPHSVDFHEKGSDAGLVDLHKLIQMDTGKETEFLEGLFERAHEENVFGVKCLVPCYEDLMFIVLSNLARNLREKTSRGGLMYALFDCKFFLEQKPDFDWKIFKENARMTGSEIHMNFSMKFINKISENILPEKIRNAVVFEKETNDYSNIVMYNRFYLDDIRTKCRAMKIKEVIFQPEKWLDYLLLKPKYVFLKCFKTHPRIIEILLKDYEVK